jgi:carbonic anhydrase
MKKLLPAFNGLAAGGGVDDSESFETEGPNAQFNLMTDVFGIIGKTNYYNYAGSLTTPGCNQGINWFLMANPMFLSPTQLLAFTSTLAAEQGGLTRGGDNRLIQPLNNRVVSKSFK